MSGGADQPPSITVNGQPRPLPSGGSLEALLDDAGLAGRPLAVEVDGVVVPRSRLAEAETITPGFNSPTISSLEDCDWCSVRAMVRRKESHGIMERLEAIGASAIIETQIANCRL